MTPEELRHRRLVRGSVILIICGVLYYCFVKVTGIGIPCFFRAITGLKCPGCGISTMLIALTEGRIQDAFEANRFIFVTSPILIFELVFAFYLAWTGKRQAKWNEVLLIIYVIALILFAVFRNLPGINW